MKKLKENICVLEYKLLPIYLVKKGCPKIIIFGQPFFVDSILLNPMAHWQ